MEKLHKLNIQINRLYITIYLLKIFSVYIYIKYIIINNLFFFCNNIAQRKIGI